MKYGVINLLKAVAAQLIVLHHLAFYGPMADQVRPFLPDLIDWLAGSARLAVQVFLVVGGFLAAKSLAPSAQPVMIDPLGAIWRRYAKLAPPFIAATLIAAVASLLASHWMDHHSISAPATVGQLAAHAALAHGVLGYPSLSAGAWYVAIDFQLYAMMVGILWLAARISGPVRRPWLVPTMVAICCAFSVLHFNLDSSWDNWAPYFFGSYGLGMAAWWAGDPRRKTRGAVLVQAAIFLPALVALAVNFRSRLALAMMVACALVIFGRMQFERKSRLLSVVNALARTSYAVFLIHFPVCLLVNAAFTRFVPADPVLQGAGMLTAWGASLVAGAAFHRWVEIPLGRLLQASTSQTGNTQRA
ncbi:acyltransferase family protein [Pseudoduganella violaceinigra]|uniref:acyltransferase family protein n=1 Tax=Pseudoduganella violaceinigra TaxID=246602 RepID=UPI0004257040|nr:acyltransferase [Pseudoduganella violaceinigra]